VKDGNSAKASSRGLAIAAASSAKFVCKPYTHTRSSLCFRVSTAVIDDRGTRLDILKGKILYKETELMEFISQELERSYVAPKSKSGTR
jgi:hypothetical protein